LIELQIRALTKEVCFLDQGHTRYEERLQQPLFQTQQ